MANSGQLLIFQQGVSVWNDRRTVYPGVFVDLSGVGTQGMDLKFLLKQFIKQVLLPER
jgi:hypothetical protein